MIHRGRVGWKPLRQEAVVAELIRLMWGAVVVVVVVVVDSLAAASDVVAMLKVAVVWETVVTPG